MEPNPLFEIMETYFKCAGKKYNEMNLNDTKCQFVSKQKYITETIKIIHSKIFSVCYLLVNISFYLKESRILVYSSNQISFEIHF